MLEEAKWRPAKEGSWGTWALWGAADRLASGWSCTQSGERKVTGWQGLIIMWHRCPGLRPVKVQPLTTVAPQSHGIFWLVCVCVLNYAKKVTFTISAILGVWFVNGITQMLESICFSFCEVGIWTQTSPCSTTEMHPQPCFCFLLWDRISPSCQGWPWICNTCSLSCPSNWDSSLFHLSALKFNDFKSQPIINDHKLLYYP